MCRINVTAELVFYVIKFVAFDLHETPFQIPLDEPPQRHVSHVFWDLEKFCIVEVWSSQCPLVVVSFYVVEVASKSSLREVYISTILILVSLNKFSSAVCHGISIFCYVSARWWFGKASWRVYKNVDEGGSIWCCAWHHLFLLAPVYRRRQL